METAKRRETKELKTASFLDAVFGHKRAVCYMTEKNVS